MKAAALDGFYAGVMAALGVVYAHDDETVAEEILKECDVNHLLRVAMKNDDPYLPNLKATMKFLKGRRR